MCIPPEATIDRQPADLLWCVVLKPKPTGDSIEVLCLVLEKDDLEDPVHQLLVQISQFEPPGFHIFHEWNDPGECIIIDGWEQFSVPANTHNLEFMSSGRVPAHHANPDSWSKGQKGYPVRKRQCLAHIVHKMPKTQFFCPQPSYSKGGTSGLWGCGETARTTLSNEINTTYLIDLRKLVCLNSETLLYDSDLIHWLVWW